MRRSLLALCCVWLLLGASCKSELTRTHDGVDVTLVSLKRAKEFTVPGTLNSFVSNPGTELAIVSVKATKEMNTDGLKLQLRDAGSRSHDAIFHQVFNFEDKHAEIEIVFEVPEGSNLVSFSLGSASFDLSKLPR
ncbi:MAG TPA: hypothetical protein VJH03_12155 [Blastocatellia bacterium]|nr:hypothetical protein [Blastocatellia bacterium]